MPVLKASVPARFSICCAVEPTTPDAAAGGFTKQGKEHRTAVGRQRNAGFLRSVCYESSSISLFVLFPFGLTRRSQLRGFQIALLVSD